MQTLKEQQRRPNWVVFYIRRWKDLGNPHLLVFLRLLSHLFWQNKQTVIPAILLLRINSPFYTTFLVLLVAPCHTSSSVSPSSQSQHPRDKLSSEFFKPTALSASRGLFVKPLLSPKDPTLACNSYLSSESHQSGLQARTRHSRSLNGSLL